MDTSMHARLAAIADARAWGIPGGRTVVPLDHEGYNAHTPHLVVDQGKVWEDAALPRVDAEGTLAYGTQALLSLQVLSFDPGGNKYRNTVDLLGVWTRRDMALLLTATTHIDGFDFDADALGIPHRLPGDSYWGDDTPPIHTIDRMSWKTPGRANPEDLRHALSWDSLRTQWWKALEAYAATHTPKP